MTLQKASTPVDGDAVVNYPTKTRSDEVARAFYWPAEVTRALIGPAAAL